MDIQVHHSNWVDHVDIPSEEFSLMACSTTRVWKLGREEMQGLVQDIR